MNLWLVVISPLMLSALLGLFLIVFIAQNRRAPGARALMVLILGASIWSLGYGLEILAPELYSKVFWAKFEYVGIAIIPIAWFIFVAQYLGYPTWMARILHYRVLLISIPVVTLFLVWTNEAHGLVWKNVQLGLVGSTLMLEIDHGPWFWGYLTFSYCLLLLGSIQLATNLRSLVRLQRWQIILALIAILLPWIGNIIYITGLSPVQDLDWTPLLFIVAGVLLTVSLFSFHLVNILPIAHKTVFAGLSDCLLVLDLQDRIADLNPVAQEMIGNRDKATIGKPLAQVLPPLSTWVERAGDVEKFQAEVSLGKGENQEFYELRISPLTGPYSIPVGRLVVLHQITRHKQNQAELERSRAQLEEIVSERTKTLMLTLEQLEKELVQRTMAEKQFKDVIESAPDAMFLVDQSGSIILMNTQAERLFGYYREELLDKNIIESLVPMQHRDRQRNYFMQFIADPSRIQTSFSVDLSAQRKDGMEFPVEIDLSHLDTEDGFWVVFNVRDISKRKQAELALRESQQTYQALFENAGEAIFLLSLDGEIHQANQKASDLLGYNKEDLQVLTISEIIVPGDFLDLKQKMDQLLAGGTLSPYIRQYRKRSGEIIPVENNTVLVRGADGKPEFFQNIARDITERLKAEREQNRLVEEIKQSNEHMRDLALRLQEAQEFERRMIATELHDRVGQNLTGLNLNLQIIENQFASTAKAEVRNRLRDSLKMVEETTRLVRDVMADLNPPVLDEFGLVAAIQWFSGDFAKRTGIATRVIGDSFVPRLPPSVEKVLYRLVQEALNNVAKHAHATHVAIRVETSEEAKTLIIEDDGLGFDPQGFDEPAAQLHWGLLSMHERATSIGAQLSIDSAPGQGTRVWVKLRNHNYDD